MNKINKIAPLVHFTSVHPRTDIRIRLKQTASLAAKTVERVVLCVLDGQGLEKDGDSGVEIVDAGPKPGSRSARMTIGAWRIWRAVRRARPKVAHFHDPELIPVGLVLWISGVKVVYDVHEDVPRQILGKFWIPVPLRRLAAWAVEAVEWTAGRYFDAIVPATPKIAERFPVDKTVVVQNFPILHELVASNSMPYRDRAPHFAYVGVIAAARGALKMVSSIGQVACAEAILRLAGNFSPKSLQEEVESLPGWAKVDYLGWTDRSQVAKLLGNVRAGLVLFHPGPNHNSAQPNKMFEYMSAGLPLIVSDFPLWREIVDGAGCGLLVNPLDTDAIADAMQWILNHPQEAEEMGRRGRQAVEEKYNWERETEKLFDLYKRL